jgi:hypothetical protein
VRTGDGDSVVPANGARSAMRAARLHAGEAIARKVAPQHRRRRHELEKLVGVTLTLRPLVAAEEEQLALHDRSAQRAAELIASQAVVAPLPIGPIAANAFVALSAWSRMNSNASPCRRSCRTS